MSALRHSGLLLPFVSVSLVVICYELGSDLSFELRLLPAVLTTVFNGLLPCFIARLTLKEFLRSCRVGFLLMSCGVFIYAVGAVAGSWLAVSPAGLNASAAVSHSGAFFAAVFQLVAVMWKSNDGCSMKMRTRKALTATLAAVCCAFCLLLIAATAAKHKLRFYNDSMPTGIAQASLLGATLGYFASAMIFLKNYIKGKNLRHYWYSLSLLLLAVSAFAMLNHKAPGDPPYWIAIMDMQLGGIFAGVATLARLKPNETINRRRLGQISDFFSDAEPNYSQLVDAAGDAILSADQDFRVILANSAAKKMFGFSEEDIAGGMGESFLDCCIAGSYKDIIREDLSTFIRRGTSNLAGTVTRMEAKSHDGRLFPIEISVSIGQHFSGWVSTYIIRDITSREQTEAQILALVDRLQQTDKNKDDFISTLSHELRNPLATLVAGLTLLDLTSDDVNAKKVIGNLQHETSFLASLISDLLDTTRISRNKIELKKQKIDIRTVISFAAEAKKALFDAKCISLLTELPQGDVYVDADPVRIKQAVDNLLHNALKYCESGGRTTLSVVSGESFISIHVKDDGIGIKPEFIPDLFEPFKQAGGALERSNGGLGLGLSIVKGITELHGGKVSAYSEGPGKGSEFIMTLPTHTGCP